MKVIETSRLSLRLISLADLENIYHLLYADPEVAVPWVGHVQSFDEVRAPNGVLSRVARATDELGLLAIESAADFALIGVAGLVPLRRSSDRARFVPASAADAVGSLAERVEAELIVALGRAHWHRGYGVEAAGAVASLGFTSLRVSRIVASVGASNERGAKLIRRLGFRVESNGRADPDFRSSVPGMIGFLDAPLTATRR